jgi:membrane protease subunit HflK
MFAAVGLAFVSLLLSRYATGMAKSPAWQLLRAPGSYLFTNFLVFLLLAVVLGAEHYQATAPGHVLCYLLPVFMLVVGGELLLNFVLDLYRPRIPGADRRFSYDSRLLNLIASPESIGHSIAEALNYQFGFEVSSTWFYQLLQRALVPLLLAGALIVWLMSSVVVVKEGEAYVVLHWGKPYPKGHPRHVLKPRRGPYLVWPWPIDTARKFDTERIHEIVLGVGEKRQRDLVEGKRAFLWTEEHGELQELDLLVAIPPRAGEQTEEQESLEEKVPSVNAIRLIVGVYYRIRDPYQFGYTVTDAAKLLEGIAYGEMVRYAASATLDEPAPGPQPTSRPAGIMSFGMADAARALHKRIAQAVSSPMDLGVDVLDVKILGCHPPPDAADAFEAVIAAEREQDRQRYVAQADGNQMLASIAGDPEAALRLAQAISFLNSLNEIAKLRRSGNFADGLSQAIKNEQKEIKRLKEEIEEERRLGKLVGARKTATQKSLERQEAFLQLLEKIQKAQKQGALNDSDLTAELEKARSNAETLFARVQGQAAVMIAEARSERWEKEFRERARAETFQIELMGLRAAPNLYRLSKRLDVLTEGLRDRRKYVLGLDRNSIEVWLNLEEPPQSISDIPLGRQE